MHVPHFLLYTMLSNTFFFNAPINILCPVGEACLPPEDLTCHPISYEACMRWTSGLNSNIVCSTAFPSSLTVAKISSSTDLVCDCSFTFSTASCVNFFVTWNTLFHLCGSSRSRKAARMAACSPSAPMSCNAKQNHKLMSNLQTSLLVTPWFAVFFGSLEPTIRLHFWQQMLIVVTNPICFYSHLELSLPIPFTISLH